MLSKIETKIEIVTKRHFSNASWIAASLQKTMIFPRYWAGLTLARYGAYKYKNNYPVHVIPILGLPKSGTTWLDQTLSQLPGFQSVLLPKMF